MYQIGIDLGGTKIAAGIMDEDRKICYQASIPTNLPQTPENLAKNIAEFVLKVLENAKIPVSAISSAGIGIPGTVNPHTGMVEYANNLDFTHVPFPKLLGAYFPFPLHAVNDAKAAAWGEYLAGAGAGSSSMIMVTLGTGIGGAVISDGKLIDGYNYASGEIGHMVIERNGRPCNCGRKGCFEVYASASALAADARKAALANPASLLNELSGNNPDKLEGKTILDAVQAGDQTAMQVFDEFTSFLSEGIINLINIFQPEILCIGGGLSGAGEKLLAPLREKVCPLVYSSASDTNTTIVCAKLGNDAGIIGAALLGN